MQDGYALLLVARDDDVIQPIERALSSARFLIHNAHTHYDAMASLQAHPFDVIIVDAAMIDREEGHVTVKAVVEATTTPVIALALDRTAQSIASQVDVRTLDSVNSTAVRQALALVLGVSVETDTGLLTPHTDDPAAIRQIDEINTLFMLSKSLAEVLDLSEVLNRVVDAARSLTEADEGMILLPEGDELYLRARVGMDVEVAQNFRIKTRDSIAGQVMHTGRSVLVGESGPYKVKTGFFVSALLYVPIILRGEVIGVLGVNNHAGGKEFTQYHRQLLENLASFAAVAIRNARTHSESLSRNRDLELLISATQALNETLTLDDALSNICVQLAQTLQVNHIQIYDWNRQTNRLETAARYDDSSWPAGRGPLIRPDQFSALRALIAANRIGWVHRATAEDARIKNWLKQLGVASMLVVPVITDDSLLGVVRVFYVNAPDDMLDTETEARLQAGALQIIAGLLNNTDGRLSDGMRENLHALLHLVGGDWADVSLPLSGDATLSVMVRIGGASWLNPPLPYIDLNDAPYLQQVVEARETIEVRAGTGKLNQAGTHLLQHTDARSLLGIPLIRNGLVEGFVVFAATNIDRIFNERETVLARAIVGQAAIALENARLIHDLESSFSELQAAQRRLIQTARLSAMGELASVVAHQMNNPLTTIIVDTELMLLDEPPESPRRESLQAIARTGKRAANVARRLLAIARPSDGENGVDYIDLVDSLRGILSLLQAHIEHAKITLNLHLPDEPLPPVKAVKGRLDDIWLNLLMNAFDALFEHPQPMIDIRAEHDTANDQVRVSVTDNGPGIPAVLQPKIFSAFFTTKPVGEGTGLGLHISREMVESVGGDITVSSEQGIYTTFEVILPVYHE